MIHPEVVAAFVARPADNHVWIKEVPERELDRELKRIGFAPARPDLPLDRHQKACLLLGVAHEGFSFWLDMGTGKTRLALELARYLMQQGEVRHGLVLVPSEESIYSTWEVQCPLWAPDVPFVALGNSPSENKWREIEELPVPGLIICTYAGLVWLLSKRRPRKSRGKVVKKDNGKAQQRAMRQTKLVDRMTATLDLIISDESTKLGNQGSTQFMAVRALRKKAKFYYNLAGRPFGRDPGLTWSQQWLADGGASLGETLTLFREAFYNTKPGYFGGFEYTLRKESWPLITQKMAHRSISYTESECGAVVPVKTEIVKVRLPEDADAYYQKAVEAVRLARGDKRTMQNIFLRMRQLSSGFVGFKDDETGERAQIVFPVNPKLIRLTQLIEEVPYDRKFVVFHDFTHSGRMVCEKLKQMGIKHGWIYGGADDTATPLRRFNDDASMRGLVVNARLGAMSLNLQIANYQFDFENPVGCIDKEQMDKRLPRKGQTRTVYKKELICFGTMDQRILNFHATGENMFDAIVRQPNLLLARD